MRFEFDPAKNIVNIAKHGVDLALAGAFELENAMIHVDDRRNYSETRYVAIGYLNGRLHIMVYTLKAKALRVIGLRKANKREQRRYHVKA